MDSLVSQLREDWQTHGRAWTFPGFQAVATYRLGRWAMPGQTPAQRLGRFAYRAASVAVRGLYGIELHVTADIGRRFKVSHQSGIVIGKKVQIGDDCRIRQNVTIGSFGSLGSKGRKEGHPVLGDRVYVAAGAVILGDVTIGDDAHIGPNAVVMTDVPAGSTAFARPATILKREAAGSA